MAKTQSGFTYKLKDVTDDFSFVELLRDYQDNPLLIIDIGKKLLGDDGYKKLKDYHTTNGKTSAEKVVADIMEIADTDPDVKK